MRTGFCPRLYLAFCYVSFVTISELLKFWTPYFKHNKSCVFKIRTLKHPNVNKRTALKKNPQLHEISQLPKKLGIHFIM